MEKQRKEAFELQTLNVILAAMNKLLTEENDRLQKEVSQLVNENEFMRQQVNTVSLSLFSFIHYYNIFFFL
jgi:homeobox-leucine zipper protein